VGLVFDEHPPFIPFSGHISALIESSIPINIDCLNNRLCLFRTFKKHFLDIIYLYHKLHIISNSLTTPPYIYQKLKLHFMRTNHKLLSAALLLIIGAISSCNKIASNLKYDLNMRTAEVTIVIPPYSDTTLNVTGTQTNHYNIDSFIKASTGDMMGIANIKSAKLMSCMLQLEQPTSTQNFANFRSCNGSFYTNGNSNPYRVSIYNNPDTYAEALNVPVDTTIDLKSYLNNNANQFTYSLGGRLRRPTTDSLRCKVSLTFRVSVQGL